MKNFKDFNKDNLLEKYDSSVLDLIEKLADIIRILPENIVEDIIKLSSLSERVINYRINENTVAADVGNFIPKLMKIKNKTQFLKRKGL